MKTGACGPGSGRLHGPGCEGLASEVLPANPPGRALLESSVSRAGNRPVACGCQAPGLGARGRSWWAGAARGAVALALCGLGTALAQVDFLTPESVLRTGGGVATVSYEQTFPVTYASAAASLQLGFGFATSEAVNPGTFLDSVTVTLQDAAKEHTAILSTSDRGGTLWQPASPGTMPLPAASLQWTPLAAPAALDPALDYQVAYLVTLLLPPEFVGAPVNVFCDLFDNQDANPSLGWISDLQLIGVQSPPLLAAIPNQSVPEAAGFRFVVQGTDVDLPLQNLSYALEEPVPGGLTLDPQTGELLWTPSEAQGLGEYSITVKVTDDGQPPLSASRTFQVQVTEVNAPPVLADVPAQTVAEGSLLRVTLAATDPDQPANRPCPRQFDDSHHGAAMSKP